MTNFMNKLFGSSSKNATSSEDFTELDLSKYEEVMDDEPAETYIRVAELTNLGDMPSLKKKYMREIF